MIIGLLLLIELTTLSRCIETPTIATSSLTFVFDVTGSMHDDLLQVIRGVTQIYNSTFHRQYSIYDYILIPFADPDVGPVFKTQDPIRFQRSLQELVVKGGGDCPEMTITALQLALEQSLPHSFIYVFTDARSKDYSLADGVLKLIQEKQSQIVFIMTGDCGDVNHLGYQIFHKIASISSGQVFSLHKQQVGEILNFVQYTIQTRKVNLLVVDQMKRHKQTYNLFIDSKLLEFTISVSGANPQVTLIDPSRNLLNPRAWFTRLLRLKEVFILNVKHPMIGEWQIQVTSSSAHAIRITGLSRLTFQPGFSTTLVSTLDRTRQQPIQNFPTYLHVEIPHHDEIRQVQSMELIDFYGNILVREPMESKQIDSNFYSTIEQFQPPTTDFYFFIRINGIDQNGHQFQRLSSTAMTSYIPLKPFVNVDEKLIELKSNLSAEIQCHVQSQLPYRVDWFRNGQLISSAAYTAQTNIISYLIDHPTESIDEGIYLCNVSSKTGFDSGEIIVDVLAPAPIVRTKPSKSVLALINRSVSIDCLVDSSKDYQLTWKQELATRKQIDVAKDRTVIYENGTLEFLNFDKSDDRTTFVCTAENEGGQSFARVTLYAQESPVVSIYPPTITYSHHWNLTLTCVDTAGIPRPQIYWKRQNEHHPIKSSSNLLIHDGILTIFLASKADEGFYQCIGSNSAGEDIQTAQLIYAELPVIYPNQSHLLVAPGETIELICHVLDQTYPNLRWFKDDQPVTRHSMNVHGHLLIRQVTEENDVGNYTCLVQNTVGSSSAMIRLDVGLEPKIETDVNEIRVELGQTAQLLCRADGLPKPQIIWFHNNTELSMRSDEHSLLMIDNIQDYHAGIYTCFAFNRFGNAQVNITLIVTIRPKFTFQTDGFLHGLVGQSLTLPCHHLAFPPSTVRWFHNHQLVESSTEENDRWIIDSTGSLTIRSLIVTDRGSYTCQVMNEIGQAKQEFQVDIYEAPSFSDSDVQPEIHTNLSQSILLPCSVHGHPFPTVVWYRGNDPIDYDRDSNVYFHSNGSLEIRQISSMDHGQFDCTATNSVGTIRRSLRINVNVPPSIVGGERATVMNVPLGQSITLICPTSGTPKPMIEWYKNNQLIESMTLNEEFVLKNIQRNDEGIYRCVATNRAGSTFRQFNVSIQISPYFDHQSTQNLSRLQRKSLIVNHSVTLLCPAIGVPKPKLMWYLNANEIHPDKKHFVVKMNGKKLLINQIRIDDEGRYICQATNDVGSIDIIYDIDVMIPPKFHREKTRVSDEEQSLKQGDYLRLSCSVEGKPTPIRRWLFNEQPIFNTSRIRFVYDGLYLEIEELTMNDAGRYTCVAENGAGHAETHFNIQVMIPPTLNDSLSHVKVSALINSSISLICAANGFPSPSIVWTYPSTIVPKIEREHELIIDHVQIDHQGIYECWAKNKVGEIRKQFQLELYEPPSIRLTNETNRFVVRRNESLTISCPADGYPTPMIRWFKNEIELYGIEKEFFIKSIEKQDAGLYSCVVSNWAGTDRRYFNVIVSEPPEILRSHINTRPSVVRGSTLTLACPFTTEHTSLIAKINTTWIPPPFTDVYQRIRQTLKLDENQLILPNVQIDDGQTWRCIVANEYGFDSLDFQLEVLVPPEISNENTDEFVQVENNHTVRLTCTTFAHPPAVIEWRKNGNRIDSNQYTIIRENHSETLQISIKDEKDGGAFTCHASNAIGKSEKHFYVDIFLPPTFEFVSTNRHKIQINRTYTLPCLVKGIPRPTIHWLKDGTTLFIDHRRMETLRDGQYLEIRYVNEDDAGIYTCVAQNSAGKAKQNLELHVLVPPRFTNDLTTIEANINSTINLTCSAEGRPKPTIVWFKDGRHIRYGHHYLTVELSSLSNDGRTMYTCTASNEAGSVEQHYRIHPLVAPSIDTISMSQPTTPIVGHHLTLECHVNGIPEPQISWYFNHRLLSSRSNRYYQIVRLSLNDTGVYTCQAENKIGNAKKDIQIDVIVPPSIVDHGQMINEIVALQGDSVVLTCLLHAVPLPTIVWTKDNQLVSLSNRISTRDHHFRLHIDRVSWNDRGRYQCDAENVAGRSQQIFDLQVYVAPEIRQKNINYNPHVVIDQTIVLSCDGFGNPEINYQWFKDQKSLFDAQSYARLFDNGAKLQIDSARLSDAGFYTCLMTNVAGQTNLTYKLDVFTPPTLDRSNFVETYQVKSNETVRLECPIFATPQPHIRWLINNQDLLPITNSIEKNIDRYQLANENRTLIIANANAHDNGRYTCIGRNIIGELRSHIDLQMLVLPIIQRDPNQIDVNVIQHHHVALSCTATGDPWPSVTWEKDGQSIEPSDPRYRIGPAGFQLLIIQVEPSQSGLFTCTAYNRAGEAREQFRLTVSIPPRIERENVTMNVIAPKPVELPCRITQGHPTPKIRWFHNDVELNINDDMPRFKRLLSPSNSLLLLHTDSLDNGRYRCMASNVAGEDVIDLHLDVFVPPTVMIEENEVLAVINAAVTLNCQADGYPLPNIVWTRSGHAIDNQPGFQILSNGSLRIHHLQREDTGFYVCWAENLVRRTHGQIRLEVQIPPSIDPIESSLSGIRGHSIRIPCPARGIPLPQISWQNVFNSSGRSMVDSFGNLVIDYLESAHAGDITCWARNPVGETSKTFVLHVRDDERKVSSSTKHPQTSANLIISPTNLIVDYGDQVELTCQTNLIHPFDIQWLHNGQTIMEKHLIQHAYDRSILHIEQANEKQTGIYQCFSNRTFNDEMIHSMAMTLVVRPHHPNLSQSQTVNVGDRLTLSCEIDSTIGGNFLGTIEWFHNGTPLKMDSFNRNRIDYRNGTLTIDKASGSDSGVYKCIFRYGNATQHESYHSVNIFTQPTFTIKLPRSTQRLVRGSMLMLHCFADAMPEPTLRWTRNGTTLITHDDKRLEILSNNSLKIDPIQLSDTGRYTCSAENALGTASTSCDVLVNEVSASKLIERTLSGQINGENFHQIPMTSNLVEKTTQLKILPKKFLDYFRNLLPFLLTPSYFALTTMKSHLNNSSSAICTMDQTFQRHIIISFSDGSYLRGEETTLNNQIIINGSLPIDQTGDDFSRENYHFFSERQISTDLGM